MVRAGLGGPALVVGGLTLLLSACGGGGSNTRPDPPPAGTPAPTPAPSPSPGPSPAPAPAPAPSVPQPAFDAHQVITGADVAHRAGLTGAGVGIGIIDSGVNRQHPTLAGRVSFSKAYINPATNNLRVDDVVGHGTVVAQLAAGAASGSWPGGIATGAKVLSARIISDKPPVDDGSGQGNEVNGALGFMGLHNDLISAGMRVMNNSWGGLYWNNPNATAPIASEYRPFIANHDGLVVFAAGNDSRANPSDMAALPSQPGPNGSRPAADLERGWLTVVALNTAEPDKLAHYSNACGIAANYCLAAPGTAAYMDPQAVSAQNATYYYGSGTSYAAPLVSGAAALVWEKFPYFSNDNVRQTLLGTATDLGAAGTDAVFGHGLLNIAAAINGPQRLDLGQFDVQLGSGQSRWGNSLSGSGGLTKRGSGHLTLDAGGHTYTGATQVLGGTLEVNGLGNSTVSISNGATLHTHGNLGGAVNNAGTLHLDRATAGAVQVSGDYTQASNGTLMLQLGDRLEATGDLVLQGGTLHLAGKRDFVLEGQTHVVASAGGQRRGVFDSITTPASLFIDADLIHDTRTVAVHLKQFQVLSVARALGVVTPASLASAQRIDSAFAAINAGQGQHTSQIPDGFVRAAGHLQWTASEDQARSSLHSLSGVLHGKAMAASLDSFGQDRAQLAGRLASGQGYGAWRQAQHHAPLAQGWQGAGWQQGQGIVLGPQLQMGMSFGQSELTPSQQADGRSQDRQTQGQLWLVAQRGQGYLLGMAGSGRNQRQLERTLQLGDLQQAAHTRYNAWMHSAALEAGWQLPAVAGWRLQLYLGLAWEQARTDGFHEGDALGFGLRADALDLRRQLGQAGVRLGWGHGDWQLDGELRWQQVLGHDGAAWQARFTGVDARAPLDTQALLASHGQLRLGMSRAFGQQAQLRLGLDKALGGVGDDHARLQWVQGF